jgi:sarcosine oxidase subunit beta
MEHANKFDVLIVGAGLWGLSLAWHLKRHGQRRVAVLERRVAGSGASCRNVGRVRSVQLTPELTMLGLAAQRKHAALAKELGRNTLFWRSGYLWVLYAKDEVERFRALLPMLKEQHCAARLLDPQQTLNAMPILSDGERPAGGMLGPRDVIVHHDAVIYAYRHACMRSGVTLKENCAVTAIDVSAGRVSGVETSHGRFEAPVVVNAAGAWSSEVSSLAQLRVANAPYRREALVTESTKPFMSAAVTFYRPNEGWFNQTLRGELVAGSITEDEPVGTSQAASPESLERTAALILRKAPRLAELRVVRQWAGLYDMTPDRNPMVGESRLPGFFQMNGCNGRGFNLGPILAELTAKLLLTGVTDPMLKAFDARRYDDAPEAKVSIGDYYAGFNKSKAA